MMFHYTSFTGRIRHCSYFVYIWEPHRELQMLSPDHQPTWTLPEFFKICWDSSIFFESTKDSTNVYTVLNHCCVTLLTNRPRSQKVWLSSLFCFSLTIYNFQKFWKIFKKFWVVAQWSNLALLVTLKIRY